MPVYRLLGDAIIDENDLAEPQNLAMLDELVSSSSPQERMSFRGGQVTAASLSTAVPLPTGETVEFVEIGVGKPLTIEIRHCYTGKHPAGNFLDRSKDMLVTSAIKSIASFNAAPRAVNFIQEQVRAGHRISNPAATEEGTPIVFYTPALVEKNTVATFEMGFDEFPDGTVQMIGNAMTQAAGIPLFLAQSTHLLAAGAITKLFATVGSRVFDRRPMFKATEALTFLRPGSSVPDAGFRLITQQPADTEMLAGYRVGSAGLVDADNNPYRGDIPYLIISLDGRRNDEYESFIPTAASAALLERYFSIREGQGQQLDPLIDALKIYNDWTFRRKADSVEAELKNLEEGTPEYEQKLAEYEALKKNILDDLLKPGD